MLKAVIFDLNGIFILSEKLSVRFEKDFGISITEFLPVLNEIMDKMRAPGAGNSFVYWQPYLAKWNISLTEQEFWSYWFKEEKPSKEMLDMAEEIKAKGLKLFLLSNNFSERAVYYAQYDWMDNLIDKAYYSWQTGFVKPDHRAWKQVLEENDLQSEECLYFDDQEKNVIAAQEVGIESFVFVDVATTKDIIEKKASHV